MKKEELLDKYIKYNSKITFDIFKLMYQKLIDLGFTSPHNVEEAFKEFSGAYPYFVMKLYNDKPYFNQYASKLIEHSEISVEDLLGYNPVESFILPEKWCIKVQEMKNTPEEIVNWRLKIVMCGTWVSPGYLNNHGCHSTKINQEYTEITLEQFKQYVLKEPIITETIPESKVESTIEYAECIEALHGLKVGQIYEVRDKRIGIYRYPATGQFKPSTKEAFEAQNKPKLIEKWSVGSYIVCIKDYGCLKVGNIGKIESGLYGITDECVTISKSVGFACMPFKRSCKWFATEAEAEEFAKTLVKSVECKECKCTNESSVDKPKQLLKQVIHCKTQEEWDFVGKKIGYTFRTIFDSDNINTINPSAKACNARSYYEFRSTQYQILSFQEWCDLNGYKMKKTRFKKGDYVVSLRAEHLSTVSIKYNYCYIQYKDGDKISIDSGTTMYQDNINYARLATPEEIEEYKRIGKPYDVTTLQTPKINTYGLNIGDTLDQDIICKWSGNAKNRCKLRETSQWTQRVGFFCGDRVIKSFKVIDGVVGFLVSGTLNIYLRAEGFKEFADNYYTETTSNFKVGSWYKYNGYYLKYSKTDNRNIFIASEYIHTEDNSFKDNLIDFTCGIADGSKELVTDLSVIQQYLPEGHPDKIVKNPIFEVGKWYKNLGTCNNAYGKFLKLEDTNNFWVSEYIYENEYSKYSGWFHCSSDIVECSLEEIQKFLPEGHPNKFIRLNGTPVEIKTEVNSFYSSTLVQRSQFNKEEIYFLPDPN